MLPEQELHKLNIPLVVQTMTEEESQKDIILSFMQEHELDTLYFNQRYDLAQRQIDREVMRAVEENKKQYKDQKVFACKYRRSVW